MLQAPLHRLAVDADGLGCVENSRLDLKSGVLGKIDRHLAAPDFVVQHLRLVKLGTRGALHQFGPARIPEVAEEIAVIEHGVERRQVGRVRGQPGVQVLALERDDAAVVAGGGGVSAVIPILGDKLQFHANVLACYGIGRYGTTQLPDATLSRSGAPVPLPAVQALAGLVARPVPTVDLYAYVGTEQVGRRGFSKDGLGYGYGSPLYVNTGCFVELSPLPCQANTSGVVQGTLGGWWRFLHGGYGTMQVGAQYSYTRRSTFSGVGGGPGTDNNVVMLSLRYLPFQ